MTKELKKRFYEEQFPELVKHTERIADALERQLELLEERQELENKHRQAVDNVQDDRREQTRKKFEAQLQKLAEVDRMARELRSKLEEKRAIETAAKAAEKESSDSPEKATTESDEENQAAQKSSIPTKN